MGRQQLVRFGALGHVGRFTAVDNVRYPRRARVVLRTSRGLELGEVLSEPDEAADAHDPHGSIVRGMAIEDQLLEARLEKNRRAAYDACAARLAEMNVPAVLVDVEHLFDGQSLVFYFLGETNPQLDALTAELAELYEAQVQFRRFSDAVTQGCGPLCGTEDAAGSGCKTCAAGCAVASACSNHH